MSNWLHHYYQSINQTKTNTQPQQFSFKRQKSVKSLGEPTCKYKCTGANEPMNPVKYWSAARVLVTPANGNQGLQPCKRYNTILWSVIRNG